MVFLVLPETRAALDDQRAAQVDQSVHSMVVPICSPKSVFADPEFTAISTRSIEFRYQNGRPGATSQNVPAKLSTWPLAASRLPSRAALYRRPVNAFPYMSK